MSTSWSPTRIAVATDSTAGNQWASCRAILSGVERSYRETFGAKAEFFRACPGMSTDETRQLAETIQRARPDCIVLVSFIPHPGELLGALSTVYHGEEFPPVIAHVSGDFNMRIQQWLDCEPVLKKTRMRFVCGSEAHQGLISALLAAPAGAVSHCPFPVDCDVFFSNPESRRNTRASLGLKDEELVVLYSGRISLQKNSIQLVSEFLEFSRSERKAKFFLAGVIDCMDAPEFGIESLPGDYQYRQWQAYLDALPAGSRGRIQFLGMKGRKQLAALNNAADVCFSLSLHHDEDYGMAPLEALSSGAVCVLTDWGGYKAFAVSDAVRLVPVSLDREGLRVSHDSIQEALVDQSRADQSAEARRVRARIYQERFSVQSLRKGLEKIFEEIPPRFEGFGALPKQYARAFERSVPFPRGPEKEALYEGIYRTYLSERSEGRPADPRDIRSANWLETNLEFRAARPKRKISSELMRYFNLLGAAGVDYVTPLNPVFLLAQDDPARLNSAPLWMSRDGLIPLAWYFFRNPRPHPAFEGKIVVHERLAPLVPEAWRAKAGTYRIVSPVTRSLPEDRRFMITGITGEHPAALEVLDARLSRSTQVLGKDVLARSEITVCLAGQENLFGEYIRRISKAFGPHVRAVPWSEIGADERTGELEILDLNDGLFCSDSFVVSCMLGLGARLAEIHPSPATGRMITISPAHAAVITDSLPSESFLLPTGMEHEPGENGLPWSDRFAQSILSQACELLADF